MESGMPPVSQWNFWKGSADDDPMNAERLLAHFDRLEAGRTVRIGIEGVARIGPHRELYRTGPEASFHPSDRRAS